jgi:hypothetical protein
VAIERQRLAPIHVSASEIELQVREIEGRVHLVDRRVVIGTHQNQILELVLATPGQQLDVVRVADLASIPLERIVQTELAIAGVPLLEPQHVPTCARWVQ